MKKLSTLFVLLFTVMMAKSQIHFTSDTVIVSAATSPSNTIQGLGYCKNVGSTGIDVTWQIIDSAAQPEWEYTGFCDKRNCYLFQINTPHSFSLSPDSVSVMRLDVAPHCGVGPGHVTVRMWVPTDSANTTKLMYFNVNMNPSTACATGISTIDANQISLYPNPIRNDMKISLPSSMDNAQVDIYNLIGSKVYSQSAIKGKDIDVSALESGLYVARISENGKVIATRKFTKAE